MQVHKVQRYGGFTIKGKASQIAAQLTAMIGREAGRIPSVQIDGGRHEIEPEHIPTNQAAVSPSERRRVLSGLPKDVQIAQLRAEISKIEGRA